MGSPDKKCLKDGTDRPSIAQKFKQLKGDTELTVVAGNLPKFAKD